jgi:hypothetical protein
VAAERYAKISCNSPNPPDNPFAYIARLRGE